MTVNSDVGPTSSGCRVHWQHVVIQFMMSGRRPADINDWSSHRIHAVCSRDIVVSTSHALWVEEAVICSVCHGKQDETRQAPASAWQAPALLNDDSQMCSASRQLLDDWCYWIPAAAASASVLASAGLLCSTWVLAGYSKVGCISTETDRRKDNECYIHWSSIRLCSTKL